MNHILKTTLPYPAYHFTDRYEQHSWRSAGNDHCLPDGSRYELLPYWFSDKIILKIYSSQEITRKVHPLFYDMVELGALATRVN